MHVKPLGVRALRSRRTLSLLLRVALALAFLYPPVAAFFNPEAWVWFVPEFADAFVARKTLLQAFGIIEIVLGLGILFMRDPRIPAATAAFILAVIVIINWQAFDIVFRDISILLAALALILLHTPANRATVTPLTETI